MTDDWENIHGSGIVVDGIGLLFFGPSGCGKSALAFDCLAEAEIRGLSSALIADDRLLVSAQDGQAHARRPAAIKGLIELRYSGIVSIRSVEEAILHFAISPTNAHENHRLPPEGEQISVTSKITLPVIRLPIWSRFPLALILAQIYTLRANRA